MIKGHTSLRYPPSAGYQRPSQRRFFVWQDRFIRYRDGHRPWRWCCTLCEPPSFGFRSLPGGWARIMTGTLPRHLSVRNFHHRHVARTHG